MLQRQKGNLKHLVSKATVHCVCPVNPVQRTQLELSLAHGGQRTTQVAQHDSIVIAQ